MSSETINLTGNVYQYLQNISLREPEVLAQLRAETHKVAAYRMQISPEQGQFMTLLMEVLNARKTLDIGTFTGYSALVVALALPSDGKVIACDVDRHWTEIARKYWHKAGVSDKIELHLAPATETLQQLLDKGEAGTFDFAFIDADKENYAAYYDKALELLRPGGIVAIDNVLWGGKVVDPEVNDEATNAIRELNKKVLHDQRVTISMLPIGDGLTLARKRAKGYDK
jgi:caffeoyl-CoA O-methyltransferase